jgi:hypothetical protein
LCIHTCNMSIFIQVPFVVYLPLHCNVSNFVDVSSPLTCRSLMMRSGKQADLQCNQNCT